jgi:4-diphosphocytidyl-2-C-methyl-D-erythritol kinase
VKAFAKINLSLRIVGRHLDGYHDLRTTLQSIALHDRLVFQAKRGPFRIECTVTGCPTDKTNLVWGAAEMIWKAAGRRGPPRNIVVSIAKRIPLRAGLGGGSSNAAAALRALSRLWRVKITGAQLHRMAAQLGADVPFFLEGGTALGVGRGDVLVPLIDRPSAWVVLVLPAFGVSTNDAYGWWDRDRTRVRGSGRRGRNVSRVSSMQAIERGNDLQAPVARRHPAIARMVRALARQGAASAAMSGSGSAVFGLFPTRRAAQSAAAALANGDWRLIVTRTLTGRQYTSQSAPADLPPGRGIV